MTITRQLALTLPGVDEQLDIFAILPTEIAGHAAEWSTPARDITTWQGMAEELAERLLDFEALTLPAQGLVIGAALAHLGLRILPGLPCPTCGGKRWLRAPVPHDEVLPGRSCPDCSDGVWTPPDSPTKWTLTVDDYLVGMHKVGTEQRTTDGLAKFIAKDALAMSNAWGVEQ